MMIRGHDVWFDYEYESPDKDENGEYPTIMLDVTAYISDYYPAVMYLRNGDPGYPEEGGEIEDLTVTGPDGVIWDEIPEALQNKLEDMVVGFDY